MNTRDLAKDLAAPEIKSAVTPGPEETSITTAKKSVEEALTYSAIATVGTHPIDVKNTRAIFNTTGKSNWVGFPSNFVANLAKAWVFFDAYSEIKKVLEHNMDPRSRLTLDVLSGVFAMSVEAIAWTPISYANMKMRIDDTIKGYWQALNAESPKNTLKALSRGAWIGAGLRNPIYAVPFFSIVREEEQLDEGEQNLFFKIAKTTATSAGAGMFASCFSYPFDLVQKWGMADPSTPLSTILLNKWQAEGVKGFYKDFSRNLKRMPIQAGALGFTIGLADTGTFEQVSKNLSSFFNQARMLPIHQTTEEEMMQACVGPDYSGNRHF